MNFVKKTLALCSFATAATAVAGLVDRPENLAFPNVNVDAHIRIIGRKYFPYIRETLDPKAGLPFLKAIEHDTVKAAVAAGLSQADAEAYAKKVSNAADNFLIVPAPKPELLEFELYLRGRNEIYVTWNLRKLPPSWEKLMALPREQRRYTTIRALYYFTRLMTHRESFDCRDIIAKMFEEKNAGCLDTQNVLYNAVRPEYLWHYGEYANENRKLMTDYLRFFTATSKAEKEWRYINENDMWRWAFFRGDNFYSGKEQNPIVTVLCRLSGRTVRHFCYDPMLRDLIVAVGLTNRCIPAASNAAKDLAMESEINYPILALRRDYATAVKLLKGKKEFAPLLAQLEIKTLHGRAKVAAIDAYLKNFPDYTREDMPNTSIALLTHMELNAIAGTELLMLGDAKGAMKYYMLGCTGEDIAIIAEKIFTIEELIAFCNENNITPTKDDHPVYSVQCANDTTTRYPNFISPKQRNYLLRNLLARRLMRAGRFEEAKKYFTGPAMLALADRYFALRAVADDQKADKAKRFDAALNLAAMLRFEGNKLFGTMLEPDNLICDSKFTCKWGKRLQDLGIVKENKIKRHMNLYKAAERYAQAAQYTDDKAQKGYCYFVAGVIIRVWNPQEADKYFKLLYYTAPQLTQKNWFKKPHAVPGIVRMWYRARVFAPNGINNMAVKLPMPAIKPAELTGVTVQEIFNRASNALNGHDAETMISFCLAAVKNGDIRGYIPMIAYYFNQEAFQTLLPLTSEYLARGGKDNTMRLCHAITCWHLGLGEDAVKTLLQVINSEKKDMKLLELANKNYLLMMTNLSDKPATVEDLAKFHATIRKINEDLIYHEDIFTDYDLITGGEPAANKQKK